MSAPSTSGLSVIKSYCYELSTLNKVYFTLLYYKVGQDICAISTQRSQSLMLVLVSAKVKPLRMGLVLGWGTTAKSP